MWLVRMVELEVQIPFYVRYFPSFAKEKKRNQKKKHFPHGTSYDLLAGYRLIEYKPYILQRILIVMVSSQG